MLTVDKEQELNRFLAREVMGWEADYAIDGTKTWKSDDKYDSCEVAYLKWNPLTNLTQAFECLEQYCDSHEDNVSWSHGKNKKYWTNIINHDEPLDVNHRYNKNRESRSRSDKQEHSVIIPVLRAESKFDEFEECF